MLLVGIGWKRDVLRLITLGVLLEEGIAFLGRKLEMFLVFPSAASQVLT